MPTRTGNFPIGFRRGWSDWQKKDLTALADWARESGFELLDLSTATAGDLKILNKSGLRVGSSDLIEFPNLMDNDAGKRRDLIARNVAYVKEIAGLGAKVFFTCVLPGDPSRPRNENYKLAVESFAPIADAAKSAGAKIAIEGYPGGPPHYGALATTPETVRAFIRELGPSVGLNYDPSHLIRLGVDHVRFLKEFVGSVFHVHGKDTEWRSEDVYEFGLYQPSAFEPGHGFGTNVWRYTLPGHGVARWPEIFSILKDAGYKGGVCVELEDERYNGSEEGEKTGLLTSLAYLTGV